MKKVVLYIYAFAAFLVLGVSLAYLSYDISRIKTERYHAARERAELIAAELNRGQIPAATSLDGVLRIELLRPARDSETTVRLYPKNAPSLFRSSLTGGSYSFAAPRFGTEARLRIRLILLGTEDLVPALRLLFGTAMGILILTGLLLSFAPGPAARGGETPRRPTAPPETREQAAAKAARCTDPASGLMTPEQLPIRLESELKRAASFDQDLALALVSLRAHDPEGENSKREAVLGAEIRAFFLFRDLIFHYAPGTACVILPNMELEEGIRSLRDFTRMVADSRPGYQVHAGLSSRSGRLLDAATLLTEAEGAIAKSRLDNEESIYGFRADPAKYRALIAREG